MARRGYRRRPTGSSWAPRWSDETARWPVIVAGPEPTYVSILEPRVSAPLGLCDPDAVRSILRASENSVLRQILSGLQVIDPVEPRLSGDFPTRPDLPTPPTPPTEPDPESFRAPSGEETTFRWIGRAIFGEQGPTPEERRRYDSAVAAYRQAWNRYEVAHQSYEQTFRRIESEQVAYDERRSALLMSLAQVQATRRKLVAKRRAAVEEDAAALERLLENAAEGVPAGVEALVGAIWRAIPLPADFPRAFEVVFDPQTGILLLTVEAPDFQRTPLTTPLKTGRKPVSERARQSTQQAVNHILPLRIAHEIYRAPELEAVQLVGVNVRLAFIDRRNGQPRHEVVASMTATRAEFEALDIAQVDPKKCFRSLRGVETPSYDEVAAVKPLLQFDSDDRRIVEGRNVVEGLEASTNLAAMDWEDFEHVVRELFARMFAARSAGAEVHVTRASRDYGVDALVYDPDPIMGGKYVIQAKRYVNTVEVSAVRDLFGTVQNEGASKGFLVTTSAFGPDAHQFAKAKPLTLIDGPQLLGLLRQYGYDFRIDLKEARRVLHGR